MIVRMTIERNAPLIANRLRNSFFVGFVAFNKILVHPILQLFECCAVPRDKNNNVSDRLMIVYLFLHKIPEFIFQFCW